jgi:hypothetical protein
MPSDTAAVIGTTAALHLSSHSVKIVVVVTAKSGVGHFELDSRPEILAYSKTRGSCRISGPIVGSFIGPASADVVIGATATIVPTDVTSWPNTVDKISEDSSSVNFSISALTPIPTAVLTLSEVINSQLKPRPQAGRHPALLYGWSVETQSPTFRGRFEFRVPLEFSGIDWVQPASW